MKLKIAIIGFGFVAEHGHLPTYLNDPTKKVVAIVDPTEERRARALLRLKDVNVYSSTKSMLADRDLRVDIVDICSPPVFHRSAIKAALEAGKHVLCEKPLILLKKDWLRLVRLSTQNKLVLYPCHNYKFSPVINKAITHIRQGQIGKPVFGSFQILRKGHAMGTREWKPHWRTDPLIAGGGISVDHGAHSIYLAQAFLGGPPRAITVKTAKIVAEKHMTDDAAIFCLEFGDAMFEITLTWLSTVRTTSYIMQGTKGQLRITEDKLRIETLGGAIIMESYESRFNDSAHSDWFRAMFRDFEHHIAQNILLPESLMEAWTIAQVTEAICNNHKRDSSTVLELELSQLPRSCQK